MFKVPGHCCYPYFVAVSFDLVKGQLKQPCNVKSASWNSPVPYTTPNCLLSAKTAATENTLLSQQSWLLKCVAIELRTLAVNRQRSHTQRLITLLLDDNPNPAHKSKCIISSHEILPINQCDGSIIFTPHNQFYTQVSAYSVLKNIYAKAIYWLCSSTFGSQI